MSQWDRALWVHTMSPAGSAATMVCVSFSCFLSQTPLVQGLFSAGTRAGLIKVARGLSQEWGGKVRVPPNCTIFKLVEEISNSCLSSMTSACGGIQV